MIEKDLERIDQALRIGRETVSRFTSGRIDAELKSGGDPVTEADLALDKVLKEALLNDGDGWLSEETVDDPVRLEKERVWIVDPLDGTREFVEGIPEWCISIGLAVNGKVIAGGICNPAADQLFIGSKETGVTLNGKKATVTEKATLEGATVLASRSEIKRGEWERFADGPLDVVPSGSVAYKLAMVAGGLADATFTLVPKNEWDIAAGCALIEAAGGKVINKDGREVTFNRPKTLLSGLIASGAKLFDTLIDYLDIQVSR